MPGWRRLTPRFGRSPGATPDARAAPRRPLRVELAANVAVAGAPGPELRLEVCDASSTGLGFFCPAELASGTLLVLRGEELDGITIEVVRSDPERATRYGARVVSERPPPLDEALQRRAGGPDVRRAAS
jgi:hypothetical protein